ncbi:MAG: hypothetical protein QMD53_00525 [Actinomycetota bacterium]|nr:hypothetical protein [Actinomycetota bacterium]
MTDEADLKDNKLINLTSKSSEELRAILDALCKEEEELSLKRRILHGRIDLIRAELTERVKAKGESSLKLDIDKINKILAEGL